MIVIELEQEKTFEILRLVAEKSCHTRPNYILRRIFVLDMNKCLCAVRVPKARRELHCINFFAAIKSKCSACEKITSKELTKICF
mgnify:CR=1 FL=1